MRVKHVHEFEPYAHYVGGTHGSVALCTCGQRRFSGAMDDAITVAFARPSTASEFTTEWHKLRLYGSRRPSGRVDRLVV